MGIQGEVLAQTREQLWRPVDGQVHFSDVFPATPGGEAWWQQADFDAGLTVAVESSGFPDMLQIPIGERSWMAPYGLVLVDDLVCARQDRVGGLDQAGEGDIAKLHPDVARELRASSLAVIALANYAPRDDQSVAGGANGSDFYLAITDAGTEIITTPLSFLRGLDARDRITSLYRIPTKGHPEFDGDHEQFRSARVGRTRRHADHLAPVFEYKTREALVAAKKDGTHPEVIPVDQRAGHIAYVDKFGNVRVELKHAEVLRTLRIGEAATLLVKNAGDEYKLDVEAASDLRSAPLGRLAVYHNVSDHVDGGSTTTGYAELIARVNGNPSTSKETAIFQLLASIPDLDPATAEVKLVKR